MSEGRFADRYICSFQEVSPICTNPICSFIAHYNITLIHLYPLVSSLTSHCQFSNVRWTLLTFPHWSKVIFYNIYNIKRCMKAKLMLCQFCCHDVDVVNISGTCRNLSAQTAQQEVLSNRDVCFANFFISDSAQALKYFQNKGDPF